MSGNVLPLVIEPDPRLHIPSKLVNIVDDEMRQLMDNMLQTMYHYNGIGLAAVQVGVHLKIIVIDIDTVIQDNLKNISDGSNVATKSSSFLHEGRPLFMVNAEITDVSEEMRIYEEGCLSFPGIRAEVRRPTSIAVKYLDYTGYPKKMTLSSDLLAVCVQHEIDHTDGIVFLDHVSRLKKNILLKKMLKFIKAHKE